MTGGLVVLGIVLGVGLVAALARGGARRSRDDAASFYRLEPGERVLLHVPVTWTQVVGGGPERRATSRGLLCVTSHRLGFGTGSSRIDELHEVVRLVGDGALPADDGRTFFVRRSELRRDRDGVHLETRGERVTKNARPVHTLVLRSDDDDALAAAITG